MRGEALTERQAQILRVIENWITEHDEGPSVRQIGRLAGLSSTGSVACGPGPYWLTTYPRMFQAA